MMVEGDMLVGMAPDGTAQAYGFLNARLRDLARYGMLYTPSWASAAREQIVSDSYVRQIQTSGPRGDLFRPAGNDGVLPERSADFKRVAVGRHLARRRHAQGRCLRPGSLRFAR
jgi:hypothetical protein